MNSRRFARAILAGVMILCALGAMAPLALPAFAQPDPAMPLVERIDSVGIVVDDLDRSLAFYTQVLPFTVVSQQEVWGEPWERLRGTFGARLRVARLSIGQEQIELIDYLTPESAAIPRDSRSNDIWFQHIAIVVSDMDAAYAHLRDHGVRHASTGPQRLPDWNPNAGGIEAFYFQDPDGHVLEVIRFPTGKGDLRWQQSDELFLGIDHTAIVVEDTDESLGFYRDTLGMSVAGTSENSGAEQERLNNVFGARVRITALRARGGGPGIELLEYLAPRTGRPIPGSASRTDLASWHVRAAATRLDAAPASVRLVSPGVIEIPDVTGPARAVSVMDPDGHVVELVEEQGVGAP